MTNFIFNWATAALATATLDLSTGNYYAHLVTTTPALGHSTVADLVIPAIIGYTGTPLTGLSYNSTRWTFDSFSFPIYNFVSSPIGVVICKRNGATPLTTDGIVCYSDFNNSIEQIISLQAGIYVVNLQFSSNGAINFSYRYQYSSGAFEELNYQGIFYLLGTQNNTTAWANPSPIKVILSTQGASAGSQLLNRVFSSNLITDDWVANFGTSKVNVGEFALNNNNATSKTTTIYGSQDGSNWTTLVSSPNLISGWNRFTIVDPTFWRYLRFTITPSGEQIHEVELFNSTILSTTANFV